MNWKKNLIGKLFSFFFFKVSALLEIKLNSFFRLGDRRNNNVIRSIPSIHIEFLFRITRILFLD